MSDETTLRDTFAAAALAGVLARWDVLHLQQRPDLAAATVRSAYELADAMLRERARNGAPDARETVPPTLTDAEREALEFPATWQDECADCEAAFARSGVRPTWPDDEPANIGPMAAAMADEIARLRLTEAEREALRAIRRTVMYLYDPHADAIDAILARLGGGA